MKQLKSVAIAIDAREYGQYGGYYGPYATVFASREGLVSVVPPADRRSVTLTWCPADFRVDDYLIVHHQVNPSLTSHSRREYYELLEGTMPAWADYPGRIHEYAVNHYQEGKYAVVELVEAVIRHEIAVKGGVCDLSEASWLDIYKQDDLWQAAKYACRKCSKRSIILAWENVAKMMFDRGLLAYQISMERYSWTATKLLPLKILRAVKARVWKDAGIDPPQFLREYPQYSPKPENVFVVASGA